MHRAEFGYHLIVDASGCNDKIRDRDTIADFACELVQAIGMKAYGPPTIEHFGHDDRQASGYTLVQLIETSHIAAHFCDYTDEAYFDIFSCKEFEHTDAVRVIEAYFSPFRRSLHLIRRQAPRDSAKAIDSTSEVAA